MDREREESSGRVKDYGLFSDKQLKRALNKWEMLFLSLGSIIGSGWLFAALATASYAGGAAVLVWIIAPILLLFIALAYAEVATAIPKTGGIVRYPYYTHGAVSGYIITWAYFISYAAVPAVEAEAAIEYLATIWHGLVQVASTPFGKITVLTPIGLALGLLFLLIFFIIQYVGVDVAGKISHVVGWWKLIVPLITIVLLLLVSFNPSNFTLGGGFFPSSSMNASKLTGFASVFAAMVATGVIFSYLGFQQAAMYGGEGKNPQRDITFAIIGSLAISTVVYTLLQVAFIGALNWSYLEVNNKLVVPGNWTALKIANVSTLEVPLATGPYFIILKTAAVAGPALAVLSVWSIILLIDAVVSPSGTGLIYLGGAGRSLYAFASNGYLPELFLKIGKTRVPVYSLITATIIGVVFLLPFPSWYALVGFITSSTVLTYIVAGIVQDTLRRTAPDLKRIYKVPRIVAPIATAVAGLLVYWSAYYTIFFLTTVILLGLSIFFAYYAVKVGIRKSYSYALAILNAVITLGTAFWYYSVAYNPEISAFNNNLLAFGTYLAIIFLLILADLLVLHKLGSSALKKEVKASYWLIGLLLATLIMSYFGSLGPDPGIPFPYDAIIAFLVYVGFHYAAVYSGFRTEAIDEIVNESKGK